MAKMKKKQQNEKLYCPYCGGLACCVQQSMFMVSVI